MSKTDLLILGATPGGIMSAISAADEGCTVMILERSYNIGGLPANGLGATDIATRGATMGLFHAFTERVMEHYVSTYGIESEQVKDASDGYHFEPHIGEKVLLDMLAEHQDKIQILVGRQFDVAAENVELQHKRPQAIVVTNRDSGQQERYEASIFIDATYEGDLAAACGAPFRLGREGRNDHHEPMAGPIYQRWGTPYQADGDGSGDERVQSYNYRLCLTDDPKNKVVMTKPEPYDPVEYEELITDVIEDRWAGQPKGEWQTEGIGRLTNIIMLPNRKTDANNQHLAFISTDLPEENYPWPTASWEWRDGFAKRQRDYTCGLFYFAQNDERLPGDFRERCKAWGFAADEYQDNGHFPRQIYVREGRRIEGDFLFTAHDAKPLDGENSRPPIHGSSITASHYALDSHGVKKREVGKPHLEGFLSTSCKPYTVPYGVMLPKAVEGLLVPVAASATHIGFSTLRMEPCWMALGEAAGVAAALAIRSGINPRSCRLDQIQDRLLDRGAVLIYIKDCGPDHPLFKPVQKLGLQGLIPDWNLEEDMPIDAATARLWATALGVEVPADVTGLTRGAFIRQMMSM